MIATSSAAKTIPNPARGTAQRHSAANTFNLLNAKYDRDAVLREEEAHDCHIGPSKNSDSEHSQEQSGRNLISIISANVHSLRPRAEVASRESDFTILQETELAPHAIGQTAAAFKPQVHQTLQAV